MTVMITSLLANQKKFFYDGHTKTVAFRKDQLVKLQTEIAARERHILEALHKDLGKSQFEGYVTEVGFVLSSISYMVKHLEEWMAPERVKTPIHLQPAQSYMVREPYGSVLIIGPFNYPFQLVMEPLIGAIAGGNCAVIKPSEVAVHTTAEVKKIIEAIFPPQFVAVVEGGKEETTILLEAPFDYLFFTGSVAVGKVVMHAAAERLTPLTLELGGKSPALVDPTANLERAAERIIWGKFVNNGQTCVAPDYVLVHEDVQERFIQRLIQAIESFYGQDAYLSPDYGRIIHDRHFQRLANLIGTEKQKIVYGGRMDRDHLFIAPTLIANINWDSPLMEDEIFGPILPILTYRDLGEAIDRIRRLPKPLAAYMFTENEQASHYFIEQLPFGGGCINDTLSHFGNIYLPAGGVGESGLHAYHGKYSFEAFTHRKSIMQKSTKVPMKIGFPPYKGKLKLVKSLLR